MKALRQELETDLGLEKNALKEQKTVITAFVDKLLAASKTVEKTPTKKGRSPATKKAPAKAPPKVRAKKDPNRPKKALTAFMFFSNAKRDQVKQDHPDIAKSVPDISRKLGELWKAASDADKVPYNELAAEDKKRYAKEMESYEPSKDAVPTPKKAKVATGGSAGGAANKYSAKAERLRNICKKASINVPMQLFKKYKQDGDVHELENGILALLEKQGLSAKSTKDEIEAARERLQLARDLEGIDTSNIIKSPEGGGRRSRRQAAVAAEAYLSQGQGSGSEESDIENDGEENEEDEEDEGGDECKGTSRENDKVAAELTRVARDEEGDQGVVDDDDNDEEEEEEEEETPATSMASLSDSEFDGGDLSSEDEGASPAPRKRGRPAEQVEKVEQEAVRAKIDSPVVAKVQRDAGVAVVEQPQGEKKAVKAEDKASQAVKMAEWSEDE